MESKKSLAPLSFAFGLLSVFAILHLGDCFSFRLPSISASAQIQMPYDPNFRPREAFNPLFRGVFDVFQAVKTKRQALFNTTHPACRFPSITCDRNEAYRRPGGHCNNLDNPSWGTPGWPFRRMLQPTYDDGHSEPRYTSTMGEILPSPRLISRTLHTLDSSATEDSHLTSLFTHFGQFLDHDIDLTPKISGDSKLDCCDQESLFPNRDFYQHDPATGGSTFAQNHPLPGTCFAIPIPQPDPFFTSTCMNFVRSKVFAPSFKCPSDVREQGNAISSFLDMSQIYGSTQELEDDLRLWSGGHLKTEGSGMLPINKTTRCKATNFPGKFCVGSGDVRVNEQPMLTAQHIVFHRFHNMVATFLSMVNRNWRDEQLFQEAKKITVGIWQHIVYNEYLPLLLGPHYIRAYSLDSSPFYRYDSTSDPRIINAFATAAFRFGHSMVPGHLKVGTTKKPLETMFFDPHHLEDDAGKGLTNFIHGTLSDFSQGSDRFFPSALSQKLFLDGAKSLDLVSLNIQRGRDHGLPGYNRYREVCGFPRLDNVDAASFLDVYDHAEDIDLFSGGLSEAHVEGGVVGDTFACIIARQFRDLKFGDRFWYENPDSVVGFSRTQLKEIKRLSFASVICQVVDVKSIQADVFKPVSDSNPLLPCSKIPQIDIMPWRTVYSGK